MGLANLGHLLVEKVWKFLLSLDKNMIGAFASLESLACRKEMGFEISSYWDFYVKIP